MRSQRRGPWYLLTGLILGAVIGLGYSWLVRPVEYTDTSPASLRANFKDEYRALIASAYAANGDLVRARARLNLLADSDVYESLAEQAQRTLAEGSAPFEARALGLLAVALGQPPATVEPGAPLPTTPAASQSPDPSLTAGVTTPSVEPSLTATAAISATQAITASVAITPAATSQPSRTALPTRTATATFTPLPTRTPTATQGAPFELDAATQVCDPDLEEALIQVETLDASEQPVPGVRIQVEWATESGIAVNTFTTGLKPEISPGYADYSMTPGVVYTVRIAPNGAPVGEISAFECERQNGERYWGGWQIVFIQP